MDVIELDRVLSKAGEALRVAGEIEAGIRECLWR